MKQVLTYIIIALLLGAAYTMTWKYSPYALYSRITQLESHSNDLAGAVISLKHYDEANEKKIQSLNYIIDVLSERYLQDRV